MERIRFIVPLRCLEIEKQIDNLFGIPGFKIITSIEAERLDIINDNSFKVSVGDNYFKKYNKCPYIYFDGDSQKLRSHFTSGEGKFFRNINVSIHTYFNILWLIGDHCISPGELTAFNEGGDQPGYHWSSKEALYSMADGNYTTVKLDQESIDNANIFYKYYLVTTKDSKAVNAQDNQKKLVAKENEAGWKIGLNEYQRQAYIHERIERSVILLEMARKNSFLPIKLSTYNIILECIYSTDDASEVSHKVSERAATLIGEDRAQKIKIMKDIKEAYGIRSKFFHGQKITKKVGKKSVGIPDEELGAISINIDELLRLSMYEVLMNAELFNGPNEPLIQKFSELLFP
jgi:hypothetical protein